jgi:hypothetical protein
MSGVFKSTILFLLALSAQSYSADPIPQASEHESNPSWMYYMESSLVEAPFNRSPSFPITSKGLWVGAGSIILLWTFLLFRTRKKDGIRLDAYQAHFFYMAKTKKKDRRRFER